VLPPHHFHHACAAAALLVFSACAARLFLRVLAIACAPPPTVLCCVRGCVWMDASGSPALLRICLYRFYALRCCHLPVCAGMPAHCCGSGLFAANAHMLRCVCRSWTAACTSSPPPLPFSLACVSLSIRSALSFSFLDRSFSHRSSGFSCMRGVITSRCAPHEHSGLVRVRVLCAAVFWISHRRLIWFAASAAAYCALSLIWFRSATWIHRAFFLASFPRASVYLLLCLPTITPASRCTLLFWFSRCSSLTGNNSNSV